MPLCEKSQWLPTSFRVKTKIPVVAKKGVHNLAPFYLSMSGPPCSATLVSLLFQEQGRFSIPQDQCCSLCLACSFFPHIHMDCSLPSFMLLLKWLLFIKDLPVLFFFFNVTLQLGTPYFLFLLGMLIFMCQPDRASGCPDMWLNVISRYACEGVSEWD